MHYELILTGKFKKSLKLAKKRGLNLKLLDTVITMLQNNIPLEEKYHDHELKGKYQGFRECHIQPDWLLIYLKENDVLTLTLVDMGRIICQSYGADVRNITTANLHGQKKEPSCGEKVIWKVMDSLYLKVESLLYTVMNVAVMN